MVTSSLTISVFDPHMSTQEDKLSFWLHTPTLINDGRFDWQQKAFHVYLEAW
jgi:hypothetical protein